MRLPVKYLEFAGTLKVHFETYKMQKILKTIGTNLESTDLIFKAFKKIILSWHCPFKGAGSVYIRWS
jgi:hypothetical protein